MPLRILVFLAWRGLVQSPLIAVLLCVAVAGGVAFQIPNDANLHGYDREIITRGVVLGWGDVRVRPREGSRFREGDELARSLAARAGVTAAVPAVTVPGAIGKQGNFKNALVIAIDSSSPRVPFEIIAGHGVPPGDATSIVVGTSVADRVGIHVGDEVQVRIVYGNGLDSLKPEDDVGRYTMKVVGLATGSFLTPEAIVVDRQHVTSELAEPHAASLILVHLADHFAAGREAVAIQREHPEVTAAAWRDDTPFLGNALDASAAIGIVSRAMVGLAVLIPVWALLYVHVLHRQRQIGIMGAIGLARLEVFAIHLMQAAIVGVVGVAAGCAGGWGIVHWFDRHPIFQTNGFVIRPDASVDTFALPALLVLATTVIAGVFPAWRAARIDPARILRAGT